MNTDDFIAQLVADAYPSKAKTRAGFWVIAAGLGGSVALLTQLWGVSPELTLYSHNPLFMLKLGMMALICTHALWMLRSFSQPRVTAAPVYRHYAGSAMALMAVVLIPLTSGTAAEGLALGHSAGWALASVESNALEMTRPAWKSIWMISERLLVLAMPLFVGLLWLLRRMAPTNHAWAGASAGFLASAVAAFEFFLIAPNTLDPVSCTGFFLSMSLLPAIGAVIGHRWLRW